MSERIGAERHAVHRVEEICPIEARITEFRRNYLQRHLDAFCYRSNRRFWLGQVLIVRYLPAHGQAQGPMLQGIATYG